MSAQEEKTLPEKEDFTDTRPSLFGTIHLPKRSLSRRYLSARIGKGVFVSIDLNKLEIGQTKEQVKFILGTPMIKDAFNSSRWDYVSLITVGENKIVDKKLIVLFNDNNLLESWELVDQS